ncbi:helix-turn-helix domain-containing protein [Streptomyces sp. NPDC051104]|uniref:helix-turn-helix domain-containing protein n=1 Tax=Streptomyces sp. NPDC051104 TaxID=3155044 RepID=UPI003431016A
MARRRRKRRLELEAEYWRLLVAGVGSVEACRQLEIGRKTGYWWRAENGGLRPDYLPESSRSGRYLSLLERRRIASLRERGLTIREIAGLLGRAPSTASRESRRNSTDGIMSPSTLAFAPSTSGDGPAVKRWGPAAMACSPSPTGMVPACSSPVDEGGLLPAPAGMVPNKPPSAPHSPPAPRACGDWLCSRVTTADVHDVEQRSGGVVFDVHEKWVLAQILRSRRGASPRCSIARRPARVRRRTPCRLDGRE